MFDRSEGKLCLREMCCILFILFFMGSKFLKGSILCRRGSVDCVSMQLLLWDHDKSFKPVVRVQKVVFPTEPVLWGKK